MRTTLTRTTLSVGMLLLALTACGSNSDSGGGVASLSGNSGSDTSSKSDEQQALDWARCMRDEGVDVPDPKTDDNGNLQQGQIRVGHGSDIDPDKFQKAVEECGQPPGRQMDPEHQAAMQDAALKFAQCMRSKGYDMPDPTFDQNGGMSLQRRQGDAKIDMDDPQVQKDMNECQQAFDEVRPGDDS